MQNDATVRVNDDRLVTKYIWLNSRYIFCTLKTNVYAIQNYSQRDLQLELWFHFDELCTYCIFSYIYVTLYICTSVLHLATLFRWNGLSNYIIKGIFVFFFSIYSLLFFFLKGSFFHFLAVRHFCISSFQRKAVLQSAI